jgi:hypothetical protein
MGNYLNPGNSDFQEYSVIRPMGFAKYVGFTEGEVRALCETYHGDFSMMRQWYDGLSEMIARLLGSAN